MIDPFTVKPLDAKTIIDHVRATRGRVITVEDHYYDCEFQDQSELSLLSLNIHFSMDECPAEEVALVCKSTVEVSGRNMMCWQIVIGSESKRHVVVIISRFFWACHILFIQ